MPMPMVGKQNIKCPKAKDGAVGNIHTNKSPCGYRGPNNIIDYERGEGWVIELTDGRKGGYEENRIGAQKTESARGSRVL
jgi:hypothetical protein